MNPDRIDWLAHALFGAAVGVFGVPIIGLLSGRVIDFVADSDAENEYMLMLMVAAAAGLLAMLITMSIRAVQQKNEIDKRRDLVASIESRR